MRFSKVVFVNPCEDPASPTGFQKREFAAPGYELTFNGMSGLFEVKHAATGEARVTSSAFFGTQDVAWERDLRERQRQLLQDLRGAKVESVTVDEASKHQEKLDSAVGVRFEQHVADLREDAAARDTIPGELTVVTGKKRGRKP